MASFLKKCSKKLDNLENKRVTTKLWVTFYHMVTIVKNFVAAEQSGDWSLHLQCIQEVLPFTFTGHGGTRVVPDPGTI